MTERFRFTDDFDFKPNMQSTVGFKKGFEDEVTTGAAISGKITKAVVEAAIKAGKGELVGSKTDKPSKANG